MISMNMSPPRATAERKLARTPKVKARIRKSPSRNMGASTRCSTTTKSARSTAPLISVLITNGLPQPVELAP